MPRKRLSQFPNVEAPQLFALPELQTIAALRLEDGAAFTRMLVDHADASGQEAEDVLFEQTVCRRVHLDDVALKGSQCLDVRFDACSLLNADWEKMHCQRVEFLSSRLTGLRLVEARLDHTVFHRCQADFALFWSARLQNVRFEACQLHEASFEGVDLSGTIFRNCDLSRADMRGAVLQGVDLRGSTLSGMQIGVNELKGLIVEPQQAVELVALLGVVVEPLAADR